jgi:hypothetical protein
MSQSTIKAQPTRILALAKLLLLVIVPTLFSGTIVAQSPNSLAKNPRPKIALLGIEPIGLNLNSSELVTIAKTELESLNLYEVMDKHDIDYALKGSNLSTADCYAKQCLIETGKKIRADKMLTGTVALYGEQLSVTLKVIDVNTELLEKTETIVFLDIKNQMSKMLSLVLQKMHNQVLDNVLLTKLTSNSDYESVVNNPQVSRLNLSGPRMGFTLFTGNNADVLKAKAGQGGFDATPFMFQFGYQFEIQYLNQGEFQALFEFIPLITGLDQGKILPSFAILNGLRHNVLGFEFAFGPTFYLSNRATGYDDGNGKFVVANVAPNDKVELYEKFDSRGEAKLTSSFVFALGKSFKSGKLNIPVNVFFIPNKEGHRFGISMGFNAKRS